VKQRFGHFIAILFLSCAGMSAQKCAAQAHAAAIKATPVGTSATEIIEFGEQYLGSELYDAKIAVLEIERGEKAWEQIREASVLNPEPKSGDEYLLARVRFEFAARTSPANDTYDLNPSQFTATNASGGEIESPQLVAQPQPELRGALKAGDSVEGWLVFEVPRKLLRPRMVFCEDVGQVSHRGGGTWFQLYTTQRSAESQSAR
jgi:Domain of unknown function (DUF4352)